MGILRTIFLILSLALAESQDIPDDSRERVSEKRDAPLILDRAGSSEIEVIDEKVRMRWSGGVMLHQEDLYLSCTEALYDESLGMVDLRGDVLFDDREKKRTLSAGRVIYYPERKCLEAYTDVVLRDNEEMRELHAGELAFNRITSYGEARSSPRLVMYSGSESPERTQEEGDFQPEPRDSITIHAENFGFDLEERIFLARNEVCIDMDTASGRAGYGEFHDTDKALYLDISPEIVRDEGDVITGATMDIQLNDEQDEIERIEVYGNCQSLHPVEEGAQKEEGGGGYFNSLKGDSMDVHFSGDSIRSVLVRGNAYSIYYPKHDEGSSHTAVSNKVQGAAIHLSFAESEIERVLVSGNVQGTYLFTESNSETEE
jgi:hypothetical protein